MPSKICLIVMAGLQSFSSSSNERHTVPENKIEHLKSETGNIIPKTYSYQMDTHLDEREEAQIYTWEEMKGSHL